LRRRERQSVQRQQRQWRLAREFWRIATTTSAAAAASATTSAAAGAAARATSAAAGAAARATSAAAAAAAGERQ